MQSKSVKVYIRDVDLKINAEYIFYPIAIFIEMWFDLNASTFYIRHSAIPTLYH